MTSPQLTVFSTIQDQYTRFNYIFILAINNPINEIKKNAIYSSFERNKAKE